jgi:hypothetical protein
MIGLVASPFGNLTVLWSGLAKESDKTKQEIIRYYEDNYTSVAIKTAQNQSFISILLKKVNFN